MITSKKTKIILEQALALTFFSFMGGSIILAFAFAWSSYNSSEQNLCLVGLTCGMMGLMIMLSSAISLVTAKEKRIKKK